jgi:hypothetical protein
MSKLFSSSKEAGYLVVGKVNVAREGTVRHWQYQQILESTTTDEAAEKIRCTMSKPWDVIRLALCAGVFELGTRMALPPVEAKPAKVAKVKAVKVAPKATKSTKAPAKVAKSKPFLSKPWPGVIQASF